MWLWRGREAGWEATGPGESVCVLTRNASLSEEGRWSGCRQDGAEVFALRVGTSHALRKHFLNTWEGWGRGRPAGTGSHPRSLRKSHQRWRKTTGRTGIAEVREGERRGLPGGWGSTPGRRWGTRGALGQQSLEGVQTSRSMDGCVGRSRRESA